MKGNHPYRGRLLAGLGLATALALVACATPTPYQPISSASPAEGGYSEVRLATDRWEVTFAGNNLTSREVVEGYLLYRAAELTVEQGHEWFQIVHREMERDVRREYYPEPYYDPWWGYSDWRPSWRYYDPRLGWRYWHPWYRDPFWSRELDVRTVERFEAHAEIVMHSGPKPAGNGRTFDASEVLQRLGPTIRRPSN